MSSNIESKDLKDKDFSIICNNCVGGFIYQYYNIEYKTPTIGLFILAQDYVKFLSDIKLYLSKELEFIKPEESMYYEHFKQFTEHLKFPMAKLHDIEVFFLHYKSNEEALEKWNRRMKRLNWNDLIIIMAENETCNYEVIKQFDALPLSNKVCFTKDEYPEIKSVCCIEEMKEPKRLWDVDTIMKHFDITEFINNRFNTMNK